MTPLSLTLVLHDSISPGEDPEVMDRLHERALSPLVTTLVEHSSVRLAFFISGTFAAWIEAEAPATHAILEVLIEREQIELLGGSPTLAALQGIPDRDAASHLQSMSRWAQSSLNGRVRGAWLGRGGWDPTLAWILARAGMQYTFVERAQIETNGRDCDGQSPWYVAEREGAAVGVIPVDPRLSALIPWAGAASVRAELRARQTSGERFLTGAVALESLGLAHGSRRWCWNGERGFLPGLLRTFGEGADWLRTLLPRQAVEGNRPGGRVYPSAGSGTSDVLTAKQSEAWQRVRRDIDEGLDPNILRFSRWITAPPWEACLASREERNLLHKRALRTSSTINRLRRHLREDKAAKPTPARTRALDEGRGLLFSAQAGALFHGSAHGGIERPDLRHAAWRALLRAELTCRTALGEHAADHHEVVDLDCDGQREVLVTTPAFSAVVRPSTGGAVVELGLWGIGNIASVLARQEEPWFSQVQEAAHLPALVTERATISPSIDLLSGDESLLSMAEEESLVSSVSGVFGNVAPPLPEPAALPLPEFDASLALAVDRAGRHLFQEHFLGPGTRLESLRRDQHAQDGDFLHEPYALLSAERRDDGDLLVTMAREGVVQSDGQERLVRVLKRLNFPSGKARIEASYEVANRYREPVGTTFAVGFNLGLDGRLGPQRFLQAGNQRAMLDQDGTWTNVRELSWVIGDQGLRVTIECSEPATLTFFALRSLVRTCEGYRLAHQGTCLMFGWPLKLWGDERRRFELSLSADTPRER